MEADRRPRRAWLHTHRDPDSAQQWHEAIGDPNQADAICDRKARTAWTLKGASLRKTKAAPKAFDNADA